MVDSFSQSIGKLATLVESAVDELGWDQPALLWPMIPVDIDQQTHSGEVAIAFALTDPIVLAGYPVDAIVGVALTDDAIGAALSMEGYDYSDASKAAYGAGEPLAFSPAQDPDRCEVRTVTILLRDGTCAVVMRHRGSEPEAIPQGMLLEGRLSQRLRRVIGLPSVSIGFSPLELCVHLAAAVVTTLAGQVYTHALAGPPPGELATLTPEQIAEGMTAALLGMPLEALMTPLGAYGRVLCHSLETMSLPQLNSATHGPSWDAVVRHARTVADDPELSDDLASELRWFDAGLLVVEALTLAPDVTAPEVDALESAGAPADLCEILRASLLSSEQIGTITI